MSDMGATTDMHDEPTNPGTGAILRAIDAKDRKDEARHKLVFDELQLIWGSVRKLEGRVDKVERSAFPTLPIWALVLVCSLNTALETVRLWVHR